MGGTPNQGQNPDSSGQYGGYSGYTPPKSTNPKDDPYNSQWYAPPEDTGYQGTAQDSVGQQQQYSGGQQQQYYQPPQSAANRGQQQQGTGSAAETSSFGLSARMVALLSYLFTWVGGLFFLLFERKSRFVRYSAAQSVTVFGPIFVVYLLLTLLKLIPFLGSVLLAPVLGCLINLVLIAGGLLWIFLMVQAYRGVQVRIPFASNYADALLARFSGGRRKTTI
jgi:uncharacterized membrane protein